MLIKENILAKKYATAFLNVYKNKCTSSYMENLAKFTVFISSNKTLQAILSIPSLSLIKKNKVVELIAKKLNLHRSTKTLIFILLKGKRIELMINVFKKILSLYKQQQNIHYFAITSSHQLTEYEKEIVINFIKLCIQSEQTSYEHIDTSRFERSNVNVKIETSFIVDKSLIIGIRIKGDTFLWERSIAKQFQIIEKKLLKREELW